MHLIKELRTQKEHIPVRISLERRLTAMIEDDGARYCLCKGPSDGSFMIGCDFCDEWYHGRCIGVSAAVGDALANAGDQFMCPKCASKSGVEYKFGLTSVASISDEEDEDCDEDDKQDDFQSKKEWLSKLWPPCRVAVPASKTPLTNLDAAECSFVPKKPRPSIEGVPGYVPPGKMNTESETAQLQESSTPQGKEGISRPQSLGVST